MFSITLKRHFQFIVWKTGSLATFENKRVLSKKTTGLGFLVLLVLFRVLLGFIQVSYHELF